MTARVDLHVHSCFSDGVHKPAELVAMAASENLAALALADHDSVDGIDEAISAGLHQGIEIVPAVELSVEFDRFHDVHLLGYYIDHHDAEFGARLQAFRTRRDQRGQEIIAAINRKLAGERKGSISHEEALAMADGALGRPHIARVLVGKRYARDMQDAFVRYLVPCNVPKQYFPVVEAIKEIRRVGGITVLAHPTSISNDVTQLRDLMNRLVALGLDGIEALNSMGSNDERDFMTRFAREKGLVITGGSDFHGIEASIGMGRYGSGLEIPYACLEALKKLRAARSEQKNRPCTS